MKVSWTGNVVNFDDIIGYGESECALFNEFSGTRLRQDPLTGRSSVSSHPLIIK